MYAKSLPSLICVLLICKSTSVYAQVNIQDFGPSSYVGSDKSSLALMEQTLGIENLAIEDFESLELPTGPLQIEGTGVVGVLSNDGNTWGSADSGAVLVETFVEGDRRFTISVEGGTEKLGIGFSAFESSTVGALTLMSVDGGNPIPFVNAIFPSFVFSFTVRNGYVVISKQDASPINTVEFFQSGAGDGYLIDYIAYDADDQLVGDVNCDGQIDLLDVAPFVEAISSGTFAPKADINQDGSVDLLDVGPFVDLLSSP